MKKLTKQEQKAEALEVYDQKWKAILAKYREIDEQKRQVNDAYQARCREINEQVEK